jgi:arylsulfatase A-like enzyme
LKRREFIKTIGIGSTSLMFPVFCNNSNFTKPNFVFFLIDDLGWTDVACYGSTFYETPNIDRLAKEGMRFTDAYAACPVCSPTRASILTGKYPARLNITDWIPGSDPKNRKLLGTKDIHQLPLEEVTIAEVLKNAGYATGFFGKWHLGDNGFFPEDQGFDLNKGGHWAGQPASYFYPYKNQRKMWDVPGLQSGAQGEYLTDRLTDESIQFIKANTSKQFLLYLSHYAVHTPIQSKPELTAKYIKKKNGVPETNQPDYIQEWQSLSKQKQDNAAYAAMVQSVDESVGKILNTLDELNLSDNTVIIFMSDNGGLSTLPKKRKSPTSVVPLRAGKGWLYEGGIREPMIIKWPGVVQPGSECNVPVTSTDFYPTMLEMVGLPPKPEQHADGLSLVPLLKDKGGLPRDALFWHYPHYHGSGNKPSAAIRAGDYKLIEWFEDGSIELYNLKEDISEKNNLVEKMPEKALELKTSLHNWQKDIGALKPELNPHWKKDN